MYPKNIPIYIIKTQVWLIWLFLLHSNHKTAIRGTSRPGTIPKQEEVTQESDEAGSDRDHSLYYLLASTLGHSNSSDKVGEHFFAAFQSFYKIWLVCYLVDYFSEPSLLENNL